MIVFSEDVLTKGSGGFHAALMAGKGHLDTLILNRRYCDQAKYGSMEYIKEYQEVCLDLYDLLVADGVDKFYLKRMMVGRMGPSLDRFGKTVIDENVTWTLDSCVESVGLCDYAWRMRKRCLDESLESASKMSRSNVLHVQAVGRHFVLDLDNDIHARPALEAYCLSCESELPMLAADLREMLKETRE